ncbi:MAG: FmdB family zinc ribbon protein [Burkholderiales bacterium]
MPIYEYRCSACEQKHEALQKFSDAPLVRCPQCGKDALVKLVSAAGFQLKGSGWYQTDFRGGSKPAEKKVDASGDGKAADAPAAKSDSAPAADTSAKPAGSAPPAAS